ncbi:MAG: ankyrin repeat domain-containing protein [Candidatus Poribacteria bacterium]|nr:ankyrin repeat domain-containing protein [Candidatus Poribacteria bacterium]
MKKWILCLATIFCLGVAVYSSDAKELTLDDIFPTDRVLDVQITVSERDWNKIRYQSRHFAQVLNASRQFKPPEHPYTYVDASVSIDGVAFPKVGIRKKGFIGSQSDTRPSLKIKLNHIDKKGEIDGLTNLTFNNNQQDVTQVSQFMGYALFNAIGSPAPRCAYAKVTVNGKNLGIYSHVESMRNPLLKRAFGNNKGTVYEGSVVDFYKEWENSFEHKRGDDKPGREKIKALIDVLANDQVTEQAIGKHVDLESFYRFWAIEGVLGFWDGYSGNTNNFFVYLNPETNKFHFLPWGADSLFSNFDIRKRGRSTGAPVSVKTQGLVAYKLYQLEEGKERYAKTMMDILENHWDEVTLLAETDRIAAMIEPHMIPAQLSFREEGWGREKTISFTDKLNGTRHFIRTRKSEILGEISDGMPIWKRRPHPPIVMGPDGFDSKFMRQFIELPEDNLWGAARTGDLDGIKRYLAEGADINELSPETNISPLSWATMMGHTKAAELLIQLGANVNVRQEDGGTPLHIAATLGRAELAAVLIKEGADVNAKNRGGGVPATGLHVPWEMVKFMTGMFDIELEQKEVKAGREKIAKMLNVNSSAKPQGMANDIMEAVFIGDLKVVKRAIADGTDVNARNPHSGDPLLFTAALMGHTEIMTFLLEKGADINARNRDGNTALHAAAFLGRAEAAELLLKHGVNVDIRNNHGGTAMDNATLDWDTTQAILNIIQVIEVNKAEVLAGRAKIVRFLTVHAKNVPQSKHNLWKVSANGDLSAIKNALDNGSDLNALDPQFGIPPLGWAAINGQTAAVKLLLEKGANINNRHRDGSTALHSAAFLGRIETVKLLLEKGADINARSNDGSLPVNTAQLDWGLTQLVLGILQMKVDEAEVKAGRVEVIKLLSNHK